MSENLKIIIKNPPSKEQKKELLNKLCDMLSKELQNNKNAKWNQKSLSVFYVIKYKFMANPEVKNRYF